MEGGQPGVFLPVGEKGSPRQGGGSAAGAASSSSSSSCAGGAGASGSALKRTGGDPSVTAAVESVAAGVTSLAGKGNNSGSSTSSSSISGGGGGGTKRTRSSSAEGCHRGITEAVLMVQKGKLPKLDPLEDQVKAAYEDYREDVTRRALRILTDELPRRIANFLKVVDVNAIPGTLLVCDDLAPHPPLQEILPNEQLEKLRAAAAAEEEEEEKSGDRRRGAAQAEGGGPAAGAGAAAAGGGGAGEGGGGGEAAAAGEGEVVAGGTASCAESDIEVLSARESQKLTKWLEMKVHQLFFSSSSSASSSSSSSFSSEGAAAPDSGAGASGPAAASGEAETPPIEGRSGRRRSSSSVKCDDAHSRSARSSRLGTDTGSGRRDSTGSNTDAGSAEKGNNSSEEIDANNSSGVSSSRKGGGSNDSSCSSKLSNSTSSSELSNVSSSESSSSSGTETETRLAAAEGGGGREGRGEKKMSACQQLAEQAAFVKKEAMEMRELLNAVKLFMQLHVPRIEDGNNFGVAIQEEAIHLLNRVEESAFNLYDTVMKYFLARAKLCSLLAKYPNTMDYQMAIVELDRKEWIHLKITKLDLRNNYIMLYDLICKNWQNVVAPKGRHHTTTQASLMY